MADPLFPCTVVGSYPQPDWLIDRGKLTGRFPPRVCARELWHVPPQWLAEAQNDATRLAILDMERAGMDIVTDSEIRRESYSNHFATALEGVDIDHPGSALDRSGEAVPVPCVTGPIRRRRPICVDDLRFLRSCTDRKAKITVPGPFTMSQQAQNDYYPDERECALAYADALNGEITELFAAGADVIQIDEPYIQARPEKARAYGIEALNRALRGVQGKTCVHVCFGYAALIHERPSGYSFLPELAAADCDQVSLETAQLGLDCSILEKLPGKEILLGVLDLSTQEVESPEVIRARVERALPHCDKRRIALAPDCGMKYISRASAFGKLSAMSAAARQLRAAHNA